MKKICLIALAALSGATMANAQVVMNELMQSNVDCIMDDLNNFPDSWVELYNTGDSDVNLEGYRIGLKNDFATAYELPSVTIKPNGYVLVYCDKVGEGMHADFRIDSGKGDLYLMDSEGNVVDSLEKIKKQPAPNIAYGRKSDGNSKWGYELKPTPGAANEGGLSDVILPAVAFSQPGHVWSSSQNLSVELSIDGDAPEGAYIKYTTNGSEPSATEGYVYNSPIAVYNSKVIRAKVMCDGCISIPSTAQSYIMLGREQQIPVISLVLNDKYLYDSRIGILYNNPWMQEENKNYFKDWRRPMNMEFFEPETGEAVLNQLGEMRVQGGWTRRNPLKSFALYANKRFGTKRFEYEFWPSDKPGVTDNKSIVLRNGGNDFGWGYIRDALCQRLLGRNSAAVDWQGYSPAIVYINGSYYGMLAIRERSNEDNIYANYDGLEDLDMYENWKELKSGTPDAFEEFKEFVKTYHSYDQWEEVMDVDSYCSMMALNYWIYNTDFPNNNTVIWRRNDGVDGRWRFLIKDCDFGMGAWNSNDNVGRNFADYMYNGTDEDGGIGFQLWRSIMSESMIKKRLGEFIIVYCGDFLTSDRIGEYLDELIDETHGEQQISHNKWGEGWSNLTYNYGFIRDWNTKRQRNIRTIIKTTFDYGIRSNVTVNKDMDDEEAAALGITYYEIPLSRGKFNGSDYAGNQIHLYGEAVKGWEVVINSGDPVVYEGQDLYFVVDSGNNYDIKAIPDEDGIAVAAVQDSGFNVVDGGIDAQRYAVVYDSMGRKVAEGAGRIALAKSGVYVVCVDGKAVKISL